jgi:hypothetical protein
VFDSICETKDERSTVEQHLTYSRKTGTARYTATVTLNNPISNWDTPTLSGQYFNNKSKRWINFYQPSFLGSSENFDLNRKSMTETTKAMIDPEVKSQLRSLGPKAKLRWVGQASGFGDIKARFKL